MTLQSWVDQLIAARFGSATALARLVGMELSPFTRGVRSGTLNLRNLLTLAKVSETPPGDVLRLARKSSEAALLEELYGTGRDALTPTRREVIELLDQIPEDVQQHFVAMLRHAALVARAGSSAGSTPPRSRSSRGRARANQRSE